MSGPILVFDSGLGGLTVFREIRKLGLGLPLLYAADAAAFPYGVLSDAAILARVGEVVERLIEAERPSIVVIACNTASTLVLPMLRARHAVPFVGTVPAIKPAAESTKTGLISVLATPGTVARDYTAGLIRQYASHCEVTLIGAARLARLCEAAMHGEPVADGDLRSEIAPAFQEAGGRRTDTIVLACTHYPLLMDRLVAAAPFPVAWIDPAPAIARRVRDLIGREGVAPRPAGAEAIVVTPGRLPAPLGDVFAGFGINAVRALDLPFAAN